MRIAYIASGILMILGGVVLGLYVGFWVCFIGGIVDTINELKVLFSDSGAVDALALALGIAKIVFASALGVLSATVLVLPGAALIDKKQKPKSPERLQR